MSERDHECENGRRASEAEIGQAAARTLSDPCLGHDIATATLAAAFADRPGRTATARDLLAWFDEVSRQVFGAAGAGLHEQAAVVTAALCDHLPAVAETTDHEALLLDRALAGGRAHPMLLAVIGHEISRRAGLNSLVAFGQDRYWTVLAHGEHCLPIGYTAPPSRGLDVEQLRGCCAHETAYRTLVALIGHAPAVHAARAARICDALVIDDAHA